MIRFESQFWPYNIKSSEFPIHAHPIRHIVIYKLSQVMLLGHSDEYVQDVNMQVTVAFNHFGEGLVQRIPRYLNRSDFRFFVLCFIC